MRASLQGWHELLTTLAGEAARRFGGLGPFTPAEVAALVGPAFLGAEALILLGQDSAVPVRQALRRVAALIRTLENAGPNTFSNRLPVSER